MARKGISQTPETTGRYALNRQAFIGKNKKGTQEIQEIIGDNDQDDFFPQLEVKLWDNECKLSVRYLSDEIGEEAVTTEAEKVKWRKGREEVRFYDKPQNDRHESGEFEFDIVLDEYTGKHEWVFSIRTRGLKFYRQEPLTDEEKFDKDGNEIAFQPDWITGGYVVYHDNKKNHRLGGKNYATGKVCNIPLPVAIDDDGNETFGTVDIDEENGEMRVGVSDEWLKKAEYPVTVDPTFGYTTIGSSTQAASSQEDAYGMKASSISGTLDSIKAALKNSSGSGSPFGNTSYALSDTTTYGSVFNSTQDDSLTATFQWFTKTAGSETITGDPNTVSAAPAYNPIGSRDAIAYDTGTGTSGGKWSASGWSDDNTRKYSVYATYTAAPSSAIQSVGGLAKASVASIGGLAIASVESVGGLQ